ncbi:sensor histidine kinase [Mucilaginibacter conchicola]|uniref:Oxygen sensor histidine kinase NreB n=1 Tax=Mucilaginibacter conchicola TaxID=2303333 RepID=A0A372NW58_9SPHI|nr:sensor histidine kinase [Mucilaginibacter conchicola]RFZ94101.1 sensor histidine kinase [Mucilaginibacter conchicola]
MNRVLLLALLLLFAGFKAGAQNIRQLLDSARANKQKDFGKVISFATQAYNEAKQSKQTKLEGEGAFLRGLGNYLSGKYDESLRWYFQSENIYSSIKDTSGLAELYSDMTIFYLRTKKFKEANEVSQKAVRFADVIHAKKLLPTAVNNRGLMFLDMENADSAATYFKRSYTLYKADNDKVGMSYALDYLASALSLKNQYEPALKALGEAKDLRAGVGDKIGEVLAVTNIGEIYLKQNKLKEATGNFLETLQEAKSLKYNELELYAYEILGQTYAARGMFKDAYEYQKQHLEFKNKVMDAKHSKDIEELQTKYETNKKEQENKLLTARSREQEAELSRNRIGIYALLATIIIAGLVLYLLYNRYRTRQQAKFNAAMLEEQRLRAQGIMDAEENERQRLARELHDGVGQLLCTARRHVEISQDNYNITDDNALQMIDDSIVEVRNLSHSMMPPYLLNKDLRQGIEEFICRINSKKQLEIHTEWVNTENLDLDKTTMLMLYRSMQEIIGNIFKHAKASSIHIELINHDTELTLMIIDDGVGFDKEKLMRTSKGLGLKSIESRIAYVGGHLDIDTQPGKGVTYVIEVPLQQIEAVA